MEILAMFGIWAAALTSIIVIGFFAYVSLTNKSDGPFCCRCGKPAKIKYLEDDQYYCIDCFEKKNKTDIALDGNGVPINLCEVNDDVYICDFQKNKIVYCKVKNIFYITKDNEPLVHCYSNEEEQRYDVKYSEFGKKAFRTKEEAEVKLKGLKK